MLYISQISIISYVSKTLLIGVVLNSKNVKHTHINFLDNLKNVFCSYFKPVLKNTALKITIDNKSYDLITDNFGAFKLEIDHEFISEPKITVFFNKNRIPIQQDYPVFFKNSKNKISIISDIDDTILVSHTASIFKRIGVLSFIPPRKRKTIDFTQKLLSLNSIKESNVFYVSKSESNLFALLSTFILSHNLPKGVLLLTPYLSFSQMLKEKKRKDFKLKNIQNILNNSGIKQFLLFGDDTQMDMEVYRIIANSYQDQIARIYIRQTSNKINNRKQQLWNKLKESFPNSVYFNENTDIEKELILLEELLSKQI